MRELLVIATLIALGGVASAQAPGDVYAPPPRTVRLTLDEQTLLESGSISDGQMLGGTLVALTFGFGVGQAIEGRWSETGYLFALGDGAAYGVMLYGFFDAMSCVNRCSESIDRGMNVMLLGAIAVGGLRVWQTVDAAVAPGQHNRRLRDLKMRLGMPVPMYTRLTPYVAPNHDRHGGGVAGLSLRF